MSGPKITELRAGDQIRLHMGDHPGVVISGPVAPDEQGCCLRIGPYILVQNGQSTIPPEWKLEVTQLAPRPVYVNHDREEPVDGDIARDADSSSRLTYVHVNEQWFVVANGEIVKVGSQYDHTGPMPKHLILLVSGDTGLPAAPQQDPPEPKTYGMAEDPHRPGYGPPSRSQGV